MPGGRHINVILPLKLGWEPLYSVPQDCENLQIGDRVFVPFAGRSYLGVVSGIRTEEDAAILKKVVPIYGKAEGKSPILPTEILFWREIAQYYMCTAGEVYKAAYPSVKDERVTPRVSKSAKSSRGDSNDKLQRLKEAYGKDLSDINQRLASGKTLFLNGSVNTDLLATLCLERLRGTGSGHPGLKQDSVQGEEVQGGEGGGILWLAPDTGAVRLIEKKLRPLFPDSLLVWHTRSTPAAKRLVLKSLREGGRHIILGTRSAIFLPYRKLQLVIINDEQDSSYKQSSPAPRYNGRDAALLLAKLHSASAILTSACPSLESCLNTRTGKYVTLSLAAPQVHGTPIEIIDSRAETRKNGMCGDISRKLLERMGRVTANGGRTVIFKPQKAAFPTMDELGRQFSALCPSSDSLTLTDNVSVLRDMPDISLLAIFGVDALLGRNDFRADEKALQILSTAIAGAGAEQLIVQTRETSHPVFKALLSNNMEPLLEERKEFGYPPFCRMVDIIVKDSLPGRAERMAGILFSTLQRKFSSIREADVIHCLLPKDRTLRDRKAALVSEVERFEQEQGYRSHIFFDVDPL